MIPVGTGGAVAPGSGGHGAGGVGQGGGIGDAGAAGAAGPGTGGAGAGGGGSGSGGDSSDAGGATCEDNFVRQGSGCEPGCTVCDSNAIPVTLPGGRFVGTTSGQSQNVGSCGGGAAPEAIFKLALTVTSDVFVNTHGSKLDTVVYMRRACCDMEVACNDDGDGRTTSVLSQRGLGPGTYYIFIDGAPGAAGDYVVDIFATPSSSNPGDACGNPIRITNIPIGGDTCNLQPDYDPPSGCISGDAGSPGSGPDAVYYFVLDAPATITLDTCVLTCMDSVLYVRDVCTKGVTAKGSAAMCNDDGCGASTGCSTPGHSLLSLTLAPGAHYLFVDTHPQPSGDPTQRCGTYTVTPTGIPK